MAHMNDQILIGKVDNYLLTLKAPNEKGKGLSSPKLVLKWMTGLAAQGKYDEIELIESKVANPKNSNLANLIKARKRELGACGKEWYNYCSGGRKKRRRSRRKSRRGNKSRKSRRKRRKSRKKRKRRTRRKRRR